MSSSCLVSSGSGGQVQVAEQQVVLAQVLQVARDRLLDLHDQLALLVQRGRVRRDLDAELRVLLVLEAALQARALLQPHFVATLDQIAGGGRHQCDATFEGLGFLGYTDAHCCSLDCGLVAQRRRVCLSHRRRPAVRAPCVAGTRPPIYCAHGSTAPAFPPDGILNGRPHD